MAVLNLSFISSLVFLLCYSQAHVLTVRDAKNVQLTLTSSVDTVYTAITTSLTIECTLPAPSADGYEKLVSLTISKQNPDTKTIEDIVTVSGFSPDVINTVGNTSAVVSGLVDHGGSSFLRLEFVLPTTAEAGLYQCESVVLDPALQTVKIDAVKDVLAGQTTLEQLLNRFREIRPQIDSLHELKEDVNLVTSSLFKSTNAFNGSVYYFSQYINPNVYKAEAACNLIGGNLVEINNEAEFNFILQSINSNNYLDTARRYIMIGMTDLNTDGVWRYWSSGNPVSYTQWGGTNPNEDGNDCGALDSNYQYKMVDIPCENDWSAQFICEKKVQ